MDPSLVESLRILKRFFDDVHRKLPNSIDETLLCLSLDHVLCLFTGLKLLYDFEEQPYDAENVTNVDQSKFYYELRCLLNYAVAIKHLKLVPGEGTDFDLKNSIDLGDLTGLRTLEIKDIPCTMFRGLNVLCRDLESVVFNRSRVPSIELVLSSLKRTKSKRSLKKNDSDPDWNNLKVLKLRNNKINNIDQSISLANNLEVLDLSYNCIRSSDLTLGVLQRLESLLMNYNSLTSLSSIISPNMSSLIQLSISYNLLQSLEGLEGLVSLRELDVSYNLIMFPENLKQLKSLKKLDKLDISGNPLCLEKNYKPSVIMKLHPAVIDYIVLDGKRLTKREKKLFVNTLDSPDNPIPVVGQEANPQPVRTSNNKKKPRIISEIPDQANFQDDEDFLISSSFHERIDTGMSHNDIVNHFQATHEHFKPNVSHRAADDEVFRNVPLKKQTPAAADDGDNLLKHDKGGKSDLQTREDGNQEKIKIEQQQQQQSFPKDEVTSAEHRIESSSEGPSGVQIKVQAVIERSNPEGHVEDTFVDADDSSKHEGSVASEEMITTIVRMVCTDSSTLDSTMYYDAEQSFGTPSIDRSVGLLSKPRYTMDNPDAPKTPEQMPSSMLRYRCSKPLKLFPSEVSSSLGDPGGRDCSSLIRDASGLEEGGVAGLSFSYFSGLGRPFFYGMSLESQALLLRDLSAEERKYDLVPRRVVPTSAPSSSSSSSSSLELTCIIRDHWLFVVHRSNLPTLNIKEHFDLRSIKKVRKVIGRERHVKVEFDTIQWNRRNRIFEVEGSEHLFEEFFEALMQFAEEPDEKQEAECLKCGHTFEDKSPPESPPHSAGWIHSQRRSFKTFDSDKEEQVCPSCSSKMIIKSRPKQQQQPSGVKSGQVLPGATKMLNIISKQLNRKDFGPTIEDLLNRSLTSEMGQVEPSASSSELTLSGSFQSKRAGMTRFISRGIIGDDDEVKSYVDEEGQEAI